eukprot:351575-Chlamydomonas_euryale.AAC.1
MATCQWVDWRMRDGAGGVHASGRMRVWRDARLEGSIIGGGVWKRSGGRDRRSPSPHLHPHTSCHAMPGTAHRSWRG